MDIVLASTAATWLINKLLDRLSDYAIKKLLGSEGLEAEASSLSYALQRARLVLGAVSAGAAAGTKIGNDQLLPQIDRVQRLATDLARHLDELEYYDVKKKVYTATSAIWGCDSLFFFQHSKSIFFFICRLNVFLERLAKSLSLSSQKLKRSIGC